MEDAYSVWHNWMHLSDYERDEFKTFLNRLLGFS
jgi:hypothetical protein